MQYTSFILENLKTATKIALSLFGKVEGKTKPGDKNQVLTEADITIGNSIISEIKRAFPKHNIIDEEAGAINNQSDFTWVIDPIDGTSNFAAGSPLYGIMIGLLHDTKPIAGGIALPYFDECILAEKGKGTVINGKPILVTNEKKLENVLVSYQIDGNRDFPEETYNQARILAKLILNIRNIRTTGSAFDCVMTAKGVHGGYLNLHSKIWDNVAQQIIIEEAGGMYTDFYGKPQDYSPGLTNPDKIYSWCASSPALHKKLQEIINSPQN
jgi:myo-inositol-1(or 4)-monophosphatase